MNKVKKFWAVAAALFVVVYLVMPGIFAMTSDPDYEAAVEHCILIAASNDGWSVVGENVDMDYMRRVFYDTCVEKVVLEDRNYAACALYDENDVMSFSEDEKLVVCGNAAGRVAMRLVLFSVVGFVLLKIWRRREKEKGEKMRVMYSIGGVLAALFVLWDMVMFYLFPVLMNMMWPGLISALLATLLSMPLGIITFMAFFFNVKLAVDIALYVTAINIGFWTLKLSSLIKKKQWKRLIVLAILSVFLLAFVIFVFFLGLGYMPVT